MPTKKTVKKAAPPKGEVLSIRIDPRTKYGLELMSRLQRRSVTGVVEWVIQEAFKHEVFESGQHNDQDISLEDALNWLWRINEVERIVALGAAREQLLTYEEARIWKVLKETTGLWKLLSQRGYDNFRWSDVLPVWDLLKPLIDEAAQRSIVRGLTAQELSQTGIRISTEQPRRGASKAADFADDFADEDIPF